ncbi:mRNA splicing factor [Grosmannia clavigera kw1407]|uniref:Pre-mRNA-splicing factor 18 n=1 Tax=Grosmannia clavigera (strain kw1407 / UAMH 11150) TaxID=655863 RepID=F0XF99_GROCL|nr:mRNA splicing factor [Grosmannia clavigera kw1407]EFX04434.1 mRNA splicing factor [Grosmannia clavigera kw1407]
MDFASLMTAQIAKKKGSTTKSGDSSSGSDSKDAVTQQKRYIRNGEAEERRRAEYLAAQKARDAEREAKAAVKRKREEEAVEEKRIREEKRRRLAEESRIRREAREAEEERARRKRLGLPELPAAGEADADGSNSSNKDDTAADEGEDLPEDELRKALRENGAPAVLFGETHGRRLRRLRQITAAATAQLANLPVPTILASVAEKDMKVPAVPDIPRDPAGRKYLFRQLASYFNLVLREWQMALLEATPTADDETEASRGARSIMEQSRTAIKPLFRRLENGDMDDKILAAIVEIVHAAQERRYVDANDAYLRLSIGKAAWPIGVIMVGIHERSAREKLHGGDKGSVMTDDVTRKYVQSIKRCLTFAQVRWPPDDASQLMG